MSGGSWHGSTDKPVAIHSGCLEGRGNVWGCVRSPEHTLVTAFVQCGVKHPVCSAPGGALLQNAEDPGDQPIAERDDRAAGCGVRCLGDGRAGRA